MYREDLMREIDAELHRAKNLHPDMQTNHDGYATILEEMDELWEEIKATKSSRESNAKMRKEAVQLAAMACRFITDRCDV